jgi:ABC-type antimicrobial peptide transport system permease subunit
VFQTQISFTVIAGPQNGPGSGRGFGGGSFNVDQTSVEGIPVSGKLVGPITNTAIADGRTFADSDAGADVAIVDSSYATTNSLAVGGTVTLADTPFTIIGIVSSTSSASTTESDVYIPLDTAQSLSGETDNITAIYVSAKSSANVDSIQSALQAALPDATVSTEADLASGISGSLSTASSLISNLGRWLSIAVLAAAFLLAILFTISGVTRRTGEFGTLKAIGWSNGRITRQVAAESVVQGAIGGLIGAAIGLAGILVMNLISPTMSGAVGSGRNAPGSAAPVANPGTGGFPGRGGGGGGFFGGARNAASTTTDVVLHAPVMIQILLLAVALAIVGGVLAGALGGWRASRLRPAEALRSVV